MLVYASVNTQVDVPVGASIDSVVGHFLVGVGEELSVVCGYRLMAEAVPEIVVAAEVYLHDVLIVIMEIRTNLAASVVGIGIDEVARAVKHARSAREIGCRGDEGNLIDFVGIAPIDINEQVAIGLDMEAYCSVHGNIA